MEYQLDIGGQKIKARAQILGSQLWVHLNGRTHVIDLSSGSKRANKKSSSASSDILKAPMPGKVTRVFGKQGDAVTKGQALLVMEAMKMEYTLKAEMDGKILEVGATAGEQVPLGKVLVKLEPAKVEK